MDIVLRISESSKEEQSTQRENLLHFAAPAGSAAARFSHRPGPRDEKCVMIAGRIRQRSGFPKMHPRWAIESCGSAVGA